MTSSTSVRLDLTGTDLARAGAAIEGMGAQDALAINQTVDFDFDTQGFVYFTPIVFKIKEEKTKERRPSISELMGTLHRLSKQLNLPLALQAQISLWVRDYTKMSKLGAVNGMKEEVMTSQALSLLSRAKLDRQKTAVVFQDITNSRPDHAPVSSLVPQTSNKFGIRRGNHAAMKMAPIVQVDQRQLKTFDLLKLSPVSGDPKPEVSNDNDATETMKKRLARLKREQKYKVLSTSLTAAPALNVTAPKPSFT